MATNTNGAPSESAIKHFDAVVIGSGQGGTPVAQSLAQSGKKTALIESTHIQGCCVNEGCTPTKTMIASGRVAHLAKRARDYGIWNVSRTDWVDSPSLTKAMRLHAHISHAMLLGTDDQFGERPQSLPQPRTRRIGEYQCHG